MVNKQALSQRARALVEDRYAGGYPGRGLGYNVLSDELGRVQVQARSQASKHLNWWHIRDVHRHRFDYLALVEFEVDAKTVHGAWLMPWKQVSEVAHSQIKGSDGTEVTKIAVRGNWKGVVARLDVGH
jgi:hypothetical protein